VSRFVRRALLVAVLALVAVPFTAVGSSAQEGPDLSITVRKVVVGTGAPSAVSVDCSGNPEKEAQAAIVEVLNFDAQGDPVPGGDTDFAIEDGAWVSLGSSGAGGECTFTEIVTGGASSTSWTCDYTFTPASAPAAAQVLQAGCQVSAGSGTGPATVIYPGNQDVSEQASTVVFTNTFASSPIQPAPQVVAQPAFTG
jgi:hypothetical protein